MKNLFDKEEIFSGIERLFVHFIEEGYSIHEIKLVMYDAIDCVVADQSAKERNLLRMHRDKK